MNEQELPTFTYIVPGTPVSLPFVIVLREPLPVHAARVIAEASTAATRIALGLLILERIVTDARQGRFEENRYPKYR